MLTVFALKNPWWTCVDRARSQKLFVFSLKNPGRVDRARSQKPRWVRIDRVRSQKPWWVDRVRSQKPLVGRVWCRS